MTVNHRRDVLDIIEGLSAQIRDLQGSRSLAQRLDSKVLTATTPSIVLTVPSGAAYSTLRVAWTGRGDTSAAATYMCVRINGDATSSYLWQINQSNGATDSSANSGATDNQVKIGTVPGATATAGYFGAGEFTIPNAAGSTFKVASGHSASFNATNSGYSGTYGGLWLNAAAITSITLLPLFNNLVAGSSATLYGLP